MLSAFRGGCGCNYNCNCGNTFIPIQTLWQYLLLRTRQQAGMKNSPILGNCYKHAHTDGSRWHEAVIRLSLPRLALAVKSVHDVQCLVAETRPWLCWAALGNMCAVLNRAQPQPLERLGATTSL